MPNPTTQRIGLFYDVVGDSSGVVAGRQVAVDDFVSQLSRHGAPSSFDLFCSPIQVEQVRQHLKAAGSGDGPLEVHDLRALARGPDGFDLTAWHDNQLDTYRPFALRGLAKRPFPITVLHHTLSYPELLHDHVLRLLLSDARPYDSLICSSSAARQALSTLVDHVTEAFNREYGTTLHYPGRFDVIPLGVDLQRFHPRPKEDVRTKLQLPTDAFVVLWLGRLSAIDKADLLPLLSAFSRLVRANPERELLLVCGGSERAVEGYAAVLRRFAADLGIAPEVKVVTDLREPQEWHAAADVFVSPTDNLQESFGLAPVEAMASGVPQIVSDWDGHRDTVVHGQTGWRIETSSVAADGDLRDAAFLGESSLDHLALSQAVAVDPAALERGLQALLDDEPLRQQMAHRSRERAEQHFGWPAVLERYRTLWAELAEQSRAQPEPTRQRAAYALPDYARAFGHYPTTLLSDETEVRLTDAGRALTTGDGTLPFFYNREWGCVRPELLMRVLRGVVRAADQSTAIAMGRIAQVIAKNLDEPHPGDLVKRHVLWLLKYGLIELDGPIDERLALPERAAPVSAAPSVPSREGAIIAPTPATGGDEGPRILYLLSPYVSHAAAGMRYVQCLRSLPVQVDVAEAAAEGPELSERLATADLVVIHDEPPTYAATYERLPALRAKRVAAYAVWETDLLPGAYRPGLGLVDEIWTCSGHSARALRGSGKPVHVIPHVVPPPELDPRAAADMDQRLGLPQDCYVFYTIADALNPRKNLMATLNAFHRLFPRPTNTVRLVVKQYRHPLPGLSQLPNVTAIGEMLPHQHIAALHAAGHCYVATHCAEAWGLGISDAMAHGNLAIATGYSGNMEYMNEQNAQLVAFRVEPIHAEDRAFQRELLDETMSWAYVDLDDLCDKLDQAYQRRGDGPRQEQAQRIAHAYGVEAVAELLAARLADLELLG